MTFHSRKLFFSAALAFALSGSALAAEEVKFRYLASQGGLSAHELAAELGYFEGTGITIENVGYATGGPASLIALASGDVEIGSAATSAVLNSVIGGNDFVAAYPSNGINDEVQSIFYVLEDSPIRDIKDIAGKTIAVNTLGAHLDYTIREALHSVGLPSDAATRSLFRGRSSNRSCARARSTFRLSVTGRRPSKARPSRRAGCGRSSTTPMFSARSPGGFIVLRRDFIEKHPEAARIFVEQSERALDYAREHPEETRAIFAKTLAERGENPDIAQYFRGYGVRPGGKAVERDLQFWIDVLVREGKLKEGQLSAENILYSETASN
jgi:ABC-type nitrate/sulfonate/bicarbonate transport systems, periplasmic components